MATDDWRRVKVVLAEALELRPADRAAFLDRACGGDATLRAEVDALLAADRDAGAFIDTPAFTMPEPAGGSDVNLGRRLGPYVLERLIGRGGMGAVYLARRVDDEFDQQVAVKMIRGGVDSDVLVRRFRHERQILASLDHPNIARLFDGGTTDDGLPYFVMEHVDGVAIDRYADDRRLSTPDRLRLCLRVVDAVQHAHERHVVHRDLKPGNVLVTADGHVKLLDFGIAKILDVTAEGPSTLTSLARPMTPDYASPEQVRGGEVTPATDVYALGLLLYELLTGHRPYRLATHTPEEIARVVCDVDPERPSTVVGRSETLTRADGTTALVTPSTVSETRDGSPDVLRRQLLGSLDDIVLKALRKDPRQRYATAAALGDDLRRVLDSRPVRAARGAWRYRAARVVSRHRTAVAATLLVATTIGLTAAVSRWTRPTAQAEAAVTPAPLQAARRSVAVLRFRNLSAQSSDAWLSTALAEMLTTELGGGGHLRVVPSEVVARAERDAGAALAPADDVPSRLRQSVAADYVAAGSFAVGPPPSRTIRLDVRVESASASAPAIAVAQTGSEADLFTLVADTGRALRERLGLDDNSAEVARGIRAALPIGVEATRLYGEGLDRLRKLDAVAARDLLEKAAAVEPGNPLIQTALASTWTALGYDARAQSAARRAFDTSAALTREDRLNVEGRLHEAEKQWPKAVDVYRTLWGYFADNIEYGLRLATALTSAGRAKESLVTVEDLRKLPTPQSADPRIDLVEAQAAAALGDFPRELTAARQALARARGVGALQLAARAQLAEGRSLYNQGQMAVAATSLQAARQAFEAAGDRAGLAGALNSLGAVADELGDTPAGERHYRTSYDVAEAIGDRRAMSAALNNLGLLLKDAGRFTEARQIHERALALRREVGDRNWTAVSLNNIGVVLFEQDRLLEAGDYYGQSLALAREIGDKRGEVRALHNLAIVQRETGELAAARTTYELTIPAREAINDRRGGVIARIELGMVLLAQGDVDAAREAQDTAVIAAREGSYPDGEAQATYQLGEVAMAAGDLAAARRWHEQALAVREKLGQTRTVLESQLALAKVALRDGRPAEAAAMAARARGSANEQPMIRVHAQLVTVEARLAVSDLAGAAAAAADARAKTPTTQRIAVLWSLEMAEARLEVARGRPAEARDRLAALRQRVESKGLVMAALETRLLWCEALAASRHPGTRREIEKLVADARSRGAAWIVRRAEAAGVPSP